MFLRLNYPRNYHLNFKENLVVPPKSPASDPRVISMAKSNVHASKRVLCWRPKDQGSNVAHKQATSMRGEPIPQNSNSNPPPGLPTSSNDQSPAHAPEITAINCSKCLGFGHTRKACMNLVRCQSCFNYGHKSAACLSKARNHRRYRAIPVLEDEGAGGAPLY